MPRPARPVVVVGGGLAALATAARLAKTGYRVTLVDDGVPWGGRWAHGPDDLSPTSISFPAPWRDLFRKSGRPLEDELGRVGLSLAPSPGPLHVFADTTTLRLGSRGESHAAMSDLAGGAAADAWRDLVDALSPVWQQLRFLGLETDLRGADQLTPSVRRSIWADRSLADLAADLPDSRLSVLVADLAAPHGTSSESMPAWAAVSLFIEQAFGHWSVVESATGRVLPASRLVDLLLGRLQLRRVDMRSGVRVEALSWTGRRSTLRVDGVLLTDGSRLEAEAVVLCSAPWRHYAGLPTGRLGGLTGGRFGEVPASVAREASALGRCRPALLPNGSRTVIDQSAGETLGDRIEHGSDRNGWGRPRRIAVSLDPAAALVRTVLDHADNRVDESAGIAWTGTRGWTDRPPTTSALPGLFLAGPWSRAGAGPDRELLGAALAAAAVVQALDPS